MAARRQKTALVFGAGIAGLSAAHYLIKYGFKVTVIEALAVPGGMARSERRAVDRDVPSEYSWRGFGPWYSNVFALMKEIPVVTSDGTLSTVYDDRLSGPIGFHLVEDQENPSIKDADVGSSFRISNGWRLSPLGFTQVGWLMFRQWTASKSRSEHTYANQNASKTLYKYLNPVAAKTASQVFGPFVGVDHGRASTHHVADFFKKNMFPGAKHEHKAKMEKDGTVRAPAWTQRNNSGWVILNRPSSEAWFSVWKEYLEGKGVTFRFNTPLDRLESTTNSQVTAAYLGDGERVTADEYVLAINPFVTVDVLIKSSKSLQQDYELKKFIPLTADGPHVQISFQLVFGEKITLPGGNETAVILTDSEFDITLYSQDQLFAKDVDLGNDAVSLWSGTATIDSVQGSLYGKTMLQLTKEEFIKELEHQIYRCKSLNAMVKLANKGRSLKDFDFVRIQVWGNWRFIGDDPEITTTTGDLDKWVNTTNTQLHQPATQTSFRNLFLAGAHCQTSADLWSMEGAVESGKRAAEMIAGCASTIKLQSEPFHVLKRVDEFLWKHNLPHILDCLVVCIVIGILAFCLCRMKTKH